MPTGFPTSYPIRLAPEQIAKEKAKAELAFKRNRRKSR